MKSAFYLFSFLVLSFAEPSRRKPSPWTLRSTAAWAAVRTCPRSAPRSTPNDRFDLSSSRPSSPPRLPSTPKRHLQVSNAFPKSAWTSNWFPVKPNTTCAQNRSFHLNKGQQKTHWSAALLQSAANQQSCRAVMAGGGVVLHTGSLIGWCVMDFGRH